MRHTWRELNWFGWDSLYMPRLALLQDKNHGAGPHTFESFLLALLVNLWPTRNQIYSWFRRLVLHASTPFPNTNLFFHYLNLKSVSYFSKYTEVLQLQNDLQHMNRGAETCANSSRDYREGSEQFVPLEKVWKASERAWNTVISISNLNPKLNMLTAWTEIVIRCVIREQT
jgi:hypothetical protein